MKNINIFYVIFICLFASIAELTYGLDNPPDFQIYSIDSENKTENQVLFEISYGTSFFKGIHKGSAKQIFGEVVLNQNSGIEKANFSVPIAQMETGNLERDCHMREALGIDYISQANAPLTKFPAEHVCNSKNILPSKGPDSVVFSTIDLGFISLEREIEWFEDKPSEIIVDAKMKIHGVQREIRGLKLLVQRKILNTGQYKINVKANMKIILADYKIKVKPFLGVGVGKDTSIFLNLNLLQTKELNP